MHGAGNDYIFVDTALHPIPDPAAAARAWSDRHRGIGSDGLVLIGRSEQGEDADLTMRIFNADGSEGLMCGNACRCIGKYAYEHGLTEKTEIRLKTASGIRTLMLKVKAMGTVDEVTVDMGAPGLDKDNRDEYGTFVSMGNPHYVVFADDIEAVDAACEGFRLEYLARPGERCNIEFAQMLGEDRIRMRVWERGSGLTMACGTGACATAVAAVISHRCHRQAQVVMDGGTVSIEWCESNGHVYLTGGAALAFEGEAELP